MIVVWKCIFNSLVFFKSKQSLASLLLQSPFKTPTKYDMMRSSTSMVMSLDMMRSPKSMVMSFDMMRSSKSMVMSLDMMRSSKSMVMSLDMCTFVGNY